MFLETIKRVVLCGLLLSTGGATLVVASEGPLTPMEQLGRELFFDKISQPAAQSCAACHSPKAGWAGAIPAINKKGVVYAGADRQRFGNRKPPTVAYAGFSPVFHLDGDTDEFFGGNFWDGRATGERLGNPAADQALGPFLNPVEQNMPSMLAVCEEVASSRYVDLFEVVFGEPLDCSSEESVATMYDRIGLAIAAYELSPEVSPFSSKFDVYWADCTSTDPPNSPDACGLADGDKGVLDPNGVLSEQEFDGLIEFGEYCAACHVSNVAGSGDVPPLFTNFGFENIGVPKNPDNPFYAMDTIFLDDGTAINPLGDAWLDNGLGDFLMTRIEWQAYAGESDGKHKVPTVRNVNARPGGGFTKAYMHNGFFKSLEDVVHFYNTRDVVAEDWPEPEIPDNVNTDILEGVPLGNLMLDEEAEAAIVAFLKTLDDGFED